MTVRDYVYTPAGKVPTIDLVNQMRSHRGRKTRRELVEAVGFDPNNSTHFDVIRRICKDYDITVADPGRVDPKPKWDNRFSSKAAGELRLAKEQLAKEIALARMEAAHAPPYRYDEALEW